MALPKNPITTIAPGAATRSAVLNAPLNDIQTNLVYLENEKETLNHTVDTFLGTPGNESLDTLAELASALGDNPHLAATLEHVRPDVVVGPAGTPGVTHTETNFVPAINNAGGSINKVLFLPNITFTVNREITESVRLMMSTPETYINIGTTETVFSGKVDGELNVNGSGTITISGPTKLLKINTQGNPTIKFADSGGTGSILVDGELRIAGNSYVPTQNVTDDSNRIASTEFVKNVVVDNLADTRTDRPLSANMGRELQNTKAPLDSPALTGTPTAPTPALGNHSTQIATTEFLNDFPWDGIGNKISTQASSENRVPVMGEVKSLFTTPALNGVTPSFLKKLEASPPQHNDRFGYSMAISGSRIVVGAPNYQVSSTPYNISGSAFIFDLTGKLIKMVQASNTGSSAYFGSFGHSIAVSGDRIVVGAPNEDATALSAGAVYIFDSNGNEINRIQAPNQEESIDFGYSVAISGDRIVIGDPQKNSPDFGAGIAYIYDSNGDPVKTIPASGSEASKHFGTSVSISGNRIIVGACGDDSAASDAGSACMYDSNGVFIQKIETPDAGVSNEFGKAVAISGDRIVVGAHNKGETEFGPGVGYIYDSSGTCLKKIQAAVPENGDKFGDSVAISGDRIVVGAHCEGTSADSAGAVYVFDSNGNKKNEVHASDLEAHDGFGWSLAVSGDRIIVGACSDYPKPDNTGSAYIYHNVTDNVLDLVKGLFGKS